MALSIKIHCYFLLVILLIVTSTVRGQKIDTSSSDGLFQAARKAAFDSNDYPKAKEYLFKALKKTPNYADLRIFLGRIYTWTKNYDSGRACFKQVLATQPQYEDASVAWVDLEYFSENYEKALEICKTGLRNHPASEPLLLREAKILQAEKRFTEAGGAVQKLLFLNEKNTDAIALSNSIREANKKRNDESNAVSSKLDTLSSDGFLIAARKAAFDNNDYPKAKAYLFKALQISPDYADIRIFLGRIYTWTKNYDSGRACFKKVLAAQPENEDAAVAWVDLEYFTDNYVKALEVCKTGLENNPASENLMLREAKILNAQKRFDEAERAIQKLLFLNEKNTDAIALSNSFREASRKNSENNDNAAPAKQDTSSSDGLLVAARKAAFDNKDYQQAKKYLYQALHVSPGYADIKIFLGRIHTWSKEYDSARFYFTSVLKINPAYEDASSAYIDMEYYNDNNSQALSICDSALQYHPASQALLIRKAKILAAMRRFTEADIVIKEALRIDKNNAEVRALANKVKELSTKNKIGVSYDFVSFDKQFSDPWHLVSFEYTRRTGIGSVTGRVNYANRFTDNGVQYEIEAYPRISKTFYSYVSAGYSDNVGVFPQWRGGFSLYANLPKSFEGELGVRYLKFSSDPTWIYTAYVGKYYKSWLFSGRTYLTPGTFTNMVSASYSIAASYYFGGADDLIGGTIGYGISPDDRYNSIQIDSKIRLISYKAGLYFKKKLSKYIVLSLDGSWLNQEYLPQTKGNQYQISAGCLYRF